MQKLKSVDPYKHNCDGCQWISWGHDGEKMTNMYLCKEDLVIRYSDEPSDYRSYPVQKGSKPTGMGSGTGIYFVKDEDGRYLCKHE